MRKQATQHVNAMRKRAESIANKRKEEFLGARVPKALRDKVMHEAEEQGIPVSILIRKILENAFRDEVTINSIHSSAEFKNTPPAKSTFDQVLAWEKLQLNKQIECTGCGEFLDAGTQVIVGLLVTGGTPVVLCKKCKASI